VTTRLLDLEELCALAEQIGAGLTAARSALGVLVALAESSSPPDPASSAGLASCVALALDVDVQRMKALSDALEAHLAVLIRSAPAGPHLRST
jgi:hypothetical protein